MAYKMWLLRVEGVTYPVQLNHRLFTGELLISVDGKTVFRGLREAAYVTRHKFRLPNWWSGHVEIQSIGMDCYYQLWLEGRVVDPEKDEDSLLRASANPHDGLVRAAMPNREDEQIELLRPKLAD